MKRILFTLIAIVTVIVQVQAVVINPIDIKVNENISLADGDYSVTFNPLQTRYVTGGLKVKFNIYTEAKYELNQVEKLCVGDKVNCYGRIVDVNSIDKQDDYVGVNSDEFEYGNNFYFTKTEDGMFYNIATNDCPSYEVVKGVATLVIPSSVKFMDYSEDPEKPIVIPCSKIKAKLSLEGNEISDIIIIIKGGKVASIERYYLP